MASEIQRAQSRRVRADRPKRDGVGKPGLPGQVVLVLQGGGALGAYQVGVYEALHEAGIEPDWVIGTSIGAINAALIGGNAPEDRLDRLRTFWRASSSNPRATRAVLDRPCQSSGQPRHGDPRHSRFFAPNPLAWLSCACAGGRRGAAYYTTAPLRTTLADLVDLDTSLLPHTRLTVGAVNVRNGEMRYFDSREEAVHLDHVLASGALPPAFGAVRIDGEPYWDGGIYSNTPIEAVLDDKPRRDSLIFAVTCGTRRRRAGIDLGGDGPPEGHPIRQPRRQPHRAAEADPPPAPCDPRAAKKLPQAARATER